MAQTLNTNQFKQGNVVGTIDQATNPDGTVMTVLYNPGGSGGSIVPGTGVKLVDLGASDANTNPVVDVRALDADVIEGVVIFNTKFATIPVGERITIVRKHGVVFMEASAAIVRGAKVALVLATPGTVVTQTTEAVFGKCLDKATASGQLVRIQVTNEGV
jgi:hypothetical protein